MKCLSSTLKISKLQGVWCGAFSTGGVEFFPSSPQPRPFPSALAELIQKIGTDRNPSEFDLRSQVEQEEQFGHPRTNVGAGQSLLRCAQRRREPAAHRKERSGKTPLEKCRRPIACRFRTTARRPLACGTLFAGPLAIAVTNQGRRTPSVLRACHSPRWAHHLNARRCQLERHVSLPRALQQQPWHFQSCTRRC